MKKNVSRVAAVVAAALLCASALSACEDGTVEVPGLPNDPVPTAPSAAEETADVPGSVETKVTRVIDGDTVAVAPVEGVLEPTGDGADEHVVRVLGIDAPEMNYSSTEAPECGAEAATKRLEQTLPVGMPVTIEYDAEADRTDRYGRSLAYVTTRGGTDAGLQQVADGYAMPWYPESEPQPERVPEYRMAADTAVSQGLGAHADCPSVGRG